MARNGSGTYTRVAGTPYVFNTVIDQDVVNDEMDDIATALTNSIAKDGQTTPTANLPMGGFKLTGLGAPTAAGDALRRGSAVGAVTARSSNTILAADDCGSTFVATSTFTQTLTAAATLGSGWYCFYRNDGSGVITVDPNASETIDGETTLGLHPGHSVKIICDGSNFKTISLNKARLPIRASGATETLTRVDMGTVVRTSTASTLTLPLLADVGDGEIIGFELNGTADVTVQRQSTDELSWNGATGLNAVKLTQYGDYVFLMADTGSSRWRVVSEHIQGPYFEAQYEGTGQSIGTNTQTKLEFNTEISDSHGCYDAATNYRFTPTIPGWYMVTIGAYISVAAASRAAAILYKNGSLHRWGHESYTTNDGFFTASVPVYFNGSTDYIEAYAISPDAAGTFDDALESYFTATRMR